jgi:hypothetical protein
MPIDNHFSLEVVPDKGQLTLVIKNLDSKKKTTLEWISLPDEKV